MPSEAISLVMYNKIRLHVLPKKSNYACISFSDSNKQTINQSVNPSILNQSIFLLVHNTNSPAFKITNNPTRTLFLTPSNQNPYLKTRIICSSIQ